MNRIACEDIEIMEWRRLATKASALDSEDKDARFTVPTATYWMDSERVQPAVEQYVYKRHGTPEGMDKAVRDQRIKAGHTQLAAMYEARMKAEFERRREQAGRELEELMKGFKKGKKRDDN